MSGAAIGLVYSLLRLDNDLVKSTVTAARLLPQDVLKADIFILYKKTRDRFRNDKCQRGQLISESCFLMLFVSGAVCQLIAIMCQGPLLKRPLHRYVPDFSSRLLNHVEN